MQEKPVSGAPQPWFSLSSLFRWRQHRDSQKGFSKKFCQIRKKFRCVPRSGKETERENNRQSTFRTRTVQTWKIFLVLKPNFENFSDCRTCLYFEPDYSKPKLSGKQPARGVKIVINGVSGRNRIIDLFRVRFSREVLETVGWPWLKCWFVGLTHGRSWKGLENGDSSSPVRKFLSSFQESLKDGHCAKRRENMTHASNTSAKDGWKVLKCPVLRSN